MERTCVRGRLGERTLRLINPGSLSLSIPALSTLAPRPDVDSRSDGRRTTERGAGTPDSPPSVVDPPTVRLGGGGGELPQPPPPTGDPRPDARTLPGPLCGGHTRASVNTSAGVTHRALSRARAWRAAVSRWHARATRRWSRAVGRADPNGPQHRPGPGGGTGTASRYQYMTASRTGQEGAWEPP